MGSKPFFAELLGSVTALDRFRFRDQWIVGVHWGRQINAHLGEESIQQLLTLNISVIGEEAVRGISFKD